MVIFSLFLSFGRNNSPSCPTNDLLSGVPFFFPTVPLRASSPLPYVFCSYTSIVSIKGVSVAMVLLFFLPFFPTFVLKFLFSPFSFHFGPLKKIVLHSRETFFLVYLILADSVIFAPSLSPVLVFVCGEPFFLRAAKPVDLA